MERGEIDTLTLGRRLNFEDDKCSGSPGCYFCAPLGGMLVTGRKGGRFSIILGPDAGFIFFTLALIIVPSVFLIIFYWGNFVSYAFTLSTGCLVIMYLITALSDPGVLLKTPSQSSAERGEAAADATMANGYDPPVDEITTIEAKTERTRTVWNEETRCGICDISRPQGTLHCSRCRVCIRKFDHHCPWVGKCVGEGNLRAFHTMLALACFHSIFAMLVVILILV